MTGIDTNILVRLFVQDDLDQSVRVDALLQSLSHNSPGFVPSVVLVELAWVLRTRYGVTKPQFIRHIEELLNSPEIVMENPAALKQALHRFGKTNADFADCLIERVCSQAGCTQTFTFDATAARSSGMSLL
ncbi:MAG: type II toxin-antitoxin system VapC family toxin [Terracidiphilus sp.]|jgi:predicted nucleic-acid-binding protein